MARTRTVTGVLTVALIGVLASTASANPADDTASSSTPPDGAGAPVIIGDDIRFPGYYDGLSDIAGAIEAAMANYSDVYGGIRFDEARIALVVGLYERAAHDRLTDAKAALRRIPTTHGIAIVTESTAYALAEREAVIDDIMANPDPWSQQLGAPLVSANLDEKTGAIVLGVSAPVTSGMTTAATSRGAFSVEEIHVHPQASRRDDVSPWNAGNWLAASSGTPNYHPADCTLGFTWRKWGVGGSFAGLAKHCPVNLGVTRFWHDQRHLGDLAYTDSRSDNALLTPAPGTSFSAKVWVGGTNTSTERIVVGGQSTPIVDTWVALSGANSGLNSYVIIDDRIDVAGVGELVLTDRATCEGGDSGGPWLTTQSTGPYNVIAHGQHVGELEFSNGFVGCAYQPVTYFSARMSASLVTG